MSFQPQDDPRAFANLLDAVTSAGASFGPVLHQARLDVPAFEQLCWSWLRFVAAKPALARELTPRIERALSAVSGPKSAPIDDLVSMTYAVDERSATRPVLPFQRGASAPPSSPLPARTEPTPEAIDALVSGDTIQVDPRSAGGAGALPFRAEEKDLPLERVAELVALSIVKPHEARRALDEHRIDAAELEAQRARKVRAAAELASHGQLERLQTYDRVYVETLEKHRGPITPTEYGRVVVASERRRLDEELAALGMEGARFVHIERHWVSRMAKDQELFGASMRAIREARRGS